MVLASAPATPNNASFLACSFGSGYIWTGGGEFNVTVNVVTKTKKDSPIILIELGIVMTAKSPEMARKTKKAYWSVMNEMIK